MRTLNEPIVIQRVTCFVCQMGGYPFLQTFQIACLFQNRPFNPSRKYHPKRREYEPVAFPGPRITLKRRSRNNWEVRYVKKSGHSRFPKLPGNAAIIRTSPGTEFRIPSAGAGMPEGAGFFRFRFYSRTHLSPHRFRNSMTVSMVTSPVGSNPASA